MAAGTGSRAKRVPTLVDRFWDATTKEECKSDYPHALQALWKALKVEKASPNQGIKLSLRNSLAAVFVSWLTVGLTSEFSGFYSGWPEC
jgi:hypothetical protein